METRDWTDRAFDPSTGPILVQVDTVEHLFNPIDPQPLNLRDLDGEIADWITSWAEEQHDAKSLAIEIVVADDSATGRENHVAAGPADLLHHRAHHRNGAHLRRSELIRPTAVCSRSPASQAVHQEPDTDDNGNDRDEVLGVGLHPRPDACEVIHR